MTRRVRGVVVIEPEPADLCEDCGAKRELRPYGPNGTRICFVCAMKDPNGTESRMSAQLFGVDTAKGGDA